MGGRSVDCHCHFGKAIWQCYVRMDIHVSCDPDNPLLESTPEKLYLSGVLLMDTALFLVEKIITLEAKKNFKSISRRILKIS